MSVSNPNQSPAEQQPHMLLNEAAQAAGASIVNHELAAAPNRDILISGRTLQTNLPPDFDIFEEPETPEEPSPFDRPLPNGLKPTALDSIPVGAFTVSGTMEAYGSDFMLAQIPVERNITVTETTKGKVVSAESFGEGSVWRTQPDTGELMAALGYVVGKEEGLPIITAVPTPDTIKNSAAELGVDIQFFPNDGYIPGRDYLQTFADGKYPVAMGNEAFYKHDTEDDHLTALVLGGEPLKEAMKGAAAAALEKDDATADEAAQNMDFITAQLRAIISSHSEFQGDQFGKEKGRQTFHDRAASLGITAEVADTILATAQANARTFHMNVKELDPIAA